MIKPESRDGMGLKPSMSKVTFSVALTMIVVAGAWLRFAGLTSRELWFDESCTFYAVHHLADWPTDGPEPRRELAHIPYFAALHLWTRLAGETAFGLRTFSGLMGCLGVLAVGCVGAAIGGRRVGIMAATLAAVGPLHVYYSQEARVYTMWVVEAALALYVLHRAACSVSKRWWVAYAAIAWAMVVTHYYTLLWLPASITAMIVAPSRGRFIRAWLVTHVALAIALVPIVWFRIPPFAMGGPTLWLRDVWAAYPPLLAIPRSLWALLPTGGYPSYLGSLATAPHAVEQWGGEMLGHAVLFGPAALVIVVGFAAALRPLPAGRTPASGSAVQATGRGAAAPASVQAVLFLFAHTVVFLITAFCHSLLLGPSYVVGRYDLIAWPAVTIAVAALADLDGRRLSVHRNRRAGASWLALALLVGCSAATLIGARSVPVKNEVTQRAKRVADLVAPDDLAVSIAMYRWFMTYEWHRIGFDAELISFPPVHDRQLCWDNPEAELSDKARLVADVRATLDQIERALDRGKRVWLLAHGEPTGQRWQVDQHFFAALHDAGIEVHLADETTGIAELQRSTDRPVDSLNP